ncbi:hypothetical protein M408DRAFT_23094 [Serendipita vermifera MAFF 305830]|uniref:Uncharacterized protein n=1 Tax=Serendipita vermifera MAFF 305830 TaxID=933852 RepID=A0A0C3BB25_SERVB|nr:hypothetical protein M408DRAFT_23094 [Serendipita vermifera MAFF 305830]
MWTPPNINAIPTEFDLINARDTIVALEEELINAQLRVRQLKEELKTLKAWVAPVRRLPFEILSSIFTLCGEMYWKAPLSIAAVCRLWREVVQNTPRAWFSTKVTNQKNINLLGVYLERNNQRLLHVTLQLWSLIPELAPYAHVIQCIQVPDLPEFMQGLCFSHLKSLRITSPDSKIRMAQVTIDQFPSLQHLEVSGSLIDRWNVPGVVLPPIGTLTMAHRMQSTPTLLHTLRKTLFSFEIFFTSAIYTLDSRPIRFPRLRCLKLHRYTSMASMPCKIVAPELTTYIQWNAFHTSDSLMHEDVDTITHLRFANFRSPIVFPQVRVFQLSIQTYDLSNALKAIQDGNKFPSLGTIEFRLNTDYNVLNSRPVVDEWVKQYRPTLNILFTTDKWHIDPPGTIETWAPKPYYEGMFIMPPPIKYPR